MLLSWDNEVFEAVPPRVRGAGLTQAIVRCRWGTSARVMVMAPGASPDLIARLDALAGMRWPGGALVDGSPGDGQGRIVGQLVM